MENRDRQYLDMPSMQQRPITLGEILLRQEMEEMEAAPRRSMGRTMSPTRCLGSLALGRPRRARGRTVPRQSTSAEDFDDLDEPRPSQPSQERRRRSGTSGPDLRTPRYRYATAEARLRTYYTIMNGPRPSRRRGAAAAAGSRHRSPERSVSPEILYNPFTWPRRSGSYAGNRRTRSRSATSSGSRPLSTLHGRSQRRRSSLYVSREERNSSSYRFTRSGRPHSGRPDPEPREGETDDSDLPTPVRRFINFAAEFIPVEPHAPDAEPPEWSLNVTAADFGPFAVGRSALSRARSLAVMGALSQVVDDTTEPPAPTNEN